MRIFLKNGQGLVVPTKANPDDAAYDLIATTPPNIVGEFITRPDGLRMWSRVSYIEYGTGIFIAPETERQVEYVDGGGDEGITHPEVLGETKFHTLLHPRSSISKYNLLLANSVGVVDNGYRNQIMVRFKYIFQPQDLLVVPEAGGTRIYGVISEENIYQRGDKIVQIKATPNIDIEWVTVDNLSETERGLGGFGSSGK